jgi:hypothetical protein
MTTTARGAAAGCHDRTKILTPFVPWILSSCASASIVMMMTPRSTYSTSR